jgi:guanylate kinase
LRIQTARAEYKKLDLFDYIVVNKKDELEHTLDVIESIIAAEHHRVHPRKVEL